MYNRVETDRENCKSRLVSKLPCPGKQKTEAKTKTKKNKTKQKQKEQKNALS